MTRTARGSGPSCAARSSDRDNARAWSWDLSAETECNSARPDGAIDDWPHHLAKLQAFWSSVLLTSGRCKGQPMVAHVRHEPHMTPDNFAHWLALWRRTSADLLSTEAAAIFQEKADRIAESLQLGVQFYRDRNAA